MTARQQRFVAEYLIDLNATQAAIRAGYSRKRADQQAYENLRKPDIAAAIADRQAQQLKRIDVTAERVLRQMARRAFVDSRAFYDAHGQPKPMSEWTEDMGAQAQASEVIIKNAAAGDGHTDRILRLRFWDSDKNLENLAKHFALLTEVVRVEGLDARKARLNAALTRVTRLE